METQTNVKILLNGKPEAVPAEISIRRLLESRGVNPNVVACELNLKIIKRAQLGEIYLKEGDTLEVIQMIGGG